jgi:hypothetical protein
VYYKIVRRFGPEAGDEWWSYLRWRGLDLSSFDSVDSMHRPDLFAPDSVEDWHNCINENFKLTIVTNLEYARRILDRYDSPVLIGVDIELEEGYVAGDGFLGYDIIDGDSSISLVTNCGTDEEGLFDDHIQPNGLLGDLDRALQIRDRLRRDFPADPHAADCTVWAVYKVDA